MQIKINIDEEQVSELVTAEIVKRIMLDHDYIGREAKYGVRSGIDKAVQKYIYSEKDAIIEKVVKRASIEIVKKSMPKIIEKEMDNSKNQSWIPVEVLLPQKDGMYNVTFDDEFVTSVEWLNGNWELWAGSGEVVAWMPVPEKYIPNKNIQNHKLA